MVIFIETGLLSSFIHYFSSTRNPPAAYLFLASSLAQTEFADPIWQQFQTASTVYEYSRGTEFVTYEVAHARCQALNASLPLPSTLEENRFLRAIGGSFLRLVDSPNNLTSELGDGVHYDELTNARPTYTQYCASNTYLEGQPEPIYMEFNILPGCWRPRTYTESSAFTCIRKIGPISNFPPRLSQVEQNLATVTTEARQEINSTQELNYVFKFFVFFFIKFNYMHSY
ncbi:unnamed protein product [Oikopleura dioica]|uniref:C-type lectin domain-containing protein n=1 Tax=Oikopleura dioica TaxID=34765 RepID=E4X0B6_OIKDI|nr:unnamed protein product [Oikopleura dioica]